MRPTAAICSSLTVSLALAAGTLAMPAAAQAPADGPYWTSVPTPANFVSLAGLGSTIALRTTTDARFYSGITRTWCTVGTPTGNAVVTFANDYAVVREGYQVTAWSSRTGTARSIRVSSAGTVINGPAGSTWMVVVRDGTQIWGFAPFVGEWARFTAPTANVNIVVGNYVAVVSDGASAWALSAYAAEWVPTPLNGGTIAAGGLMGAVFSTSQAQCFSARRGTWVPAPAGFNSGTVFKDEFLYTTTGTATMAFSALTNNFVQITTTGLPFVISNRCVMAVTAGNTCQFYSPGTDAVVPVVTAAPPLVTMNADLALVSDGTAVTAFSGVTGHLTPPITGSFTFVTNEDVCLAQSAAGSFAYSSILGTWTPAPAVAVTSVQTVRNAIILLTASGYEAYAARTGTWSSLATAVAGQFLTSNIGATFCAIDGATVAAFDSRLGRWCAKTMAAPYVAGSVWRMTAIVHDGATMSGFSELNNTWDEMPFTGPLVQFTANDSIAWARDATTTYVYAPNATFSTISRYAEFTRMQALGTPLRLMQLAPAGSTVDMAVSLAPGYTSFGTVGTAVLSLDPLFFIGIVPLGVAPAGGVLDVSLTLPDGTGFNGLQLFLQNIITPPTAPLYLSNAIAPILI